MTDERIFRYTGTISTLSQTDSGALLMRVKESDAKVRDATARIISRVRSGGDAALRAMAVEFDGQTLAGIEVSLNSMEAALSSIAPELRAALERAAKNIEAVHAAAPPVGIEMQPEPGITVGRRPDALARVGAYAPGGRAAYGSSVLMCVIPARVAGVEEIIVCSPPAGNGMPAPIVLAACAIAKVDRVFAVGGAGAIAAMTFGTESIPAVNKIVGPGNAYVAEAKTQVSRFVGIDSPAGPSELLVICDESSTPEAIAAEVLAQAEHDPDACVVVVTFSERSAGRISEAVRSGLGEMARSPIARAALKANGALLVARDADEALAFAASYAPEHLLLATIDAERLAHDARNAGCVFIGESSSVVFGDYITGGNHVLPTAGAARSYSGLGPLDFVRWTSYQRVSREAASQLSRDAAILAEAEGLGAHATAARRWAGAQ